MDYQFLLDIALILLSTKLLGMLTRKFRMPQVVGALVAGVILGRLYSTSCMTRATCSKKYRKSALSC